jgi:hypothetical protein
MTPLEYPPWLKAYFYILDPDHVPMPAPDIVTYGEFCAEDSNVRVGYTMVGDVEVSTVFIGVASPRHNPPRLFETMVFGGKLDRTQFRYVTWDEAEEGHRATIALVGASQNEL